MKLTVVTMAYNEAFMLYTFLLHYYSRGADSIIIYDNMSTDSTVKMCETFNREISNIVTVVQYDTSNQIRDDVYLDIKNNVTTRHPSDWYIVVDIDELLDLPYNSLAQLTDNKNSIKWYLQNIDSRIKIPNVFGVQCVTETINDYHSADYNTKMFVPDSTFNKRVVFHKTLQPIYNPGCHTFSVASENVKSLMDNIRVADETNHFILYHLKHIDLKYVINRHAEFKLRLSEYNKKHNYGHQYNMTELDIKRKFDYMKRFALTYGDMIEAFNNA